MKIKKIAFPVLFTFLCFSTSSQTNITDSLTAELNTASGEKRIKIYNLLAEEYMHISTDKALEYSLKTIEYSKKQNSISCLAAAYGIHGKTLYFSGQYKHSIAYLDSSLNIYKELYDLENTIRIMVDLSSSYTNLNKYQFALKLLFDALKLSEENQYTYGIIYTQSYIANLYTATNDFSNAKEYIQKAIKLSEKTEHYLLLARNYGILGVVLMHQKLFIESVHYLKQALYLFSFHDNKIGKANTYVDIGDYYIQINDYKSALSNYRNALQIAIELDYNRIKGTIYTKIGHTYEQQNNHQKSLEYNYKALNARESYGNKAFTGSSLINIGKNYYLMEVYDSAYIYYQRGLDIVKKTNNKKYIANCYYRLYKLFENQNNLFNALNYYIKYSDIKDSLIYESKAKELTEIQSRYELQQSRNEIQIQNLKLAKQRQKIIILVILITLTGVILLLLFYRYRTNKSISRQYQMLTKDLKNQYNKRTDELKEKEMQFRNLVEQIPMGVYRTTPDGMILFANQEVAKILGYQKAEELHNINLESEKEHYRMTREKFKSEIRQKVEIKGIESVWTKKDGTKIFVSEYARLVKDSKGRELYYEGLVEDITQRKLAEQYLKKALEQAKESDRLKSAFLSTIQHELRTPLNSIMGFSELLSLEEDLPEDVLENIELIHNSGKKLLNIINDILDASLISTGKIKLNYQSCDIRKMISELFETFNERIKSSKDKQSLELKMILPTEKEKHIIKTDKTRLRQVLSNLLDNSIKFTYKGAIELGYQLSNNNYVRFFVKDTGIGIPPEKQDIIFDQFRQAEETDTRSFGGSGLGLSISKNLVEMLGGEIWVKSTVGKGSGFFFTIPLTKVENPTVKKSARKKASPNKWKGKTILITEDNYANFLLLRTYLKTSGIDIIHAKNGEEAVRFVKNMKEIDLVLMDIQLPGISGYETTTILKKMRKDLKVIAITAYATDEDKAACFESGCDDYVAKPINHQIFMGTIEKYL